MEPLFFSFQGQLGITEPEIQPSHQQYSEGGTGAAVSLSAGFFVDKPVVQLSGFLLLITVQT